MKRPQEVLKMVESKYVPICEERLKSVMDKLDDIINQKAIEFYLKEKIYIGEEIEIPDLKEFKEEEQELIRFLMRKEVKYELEKKGWSLVEREDGLYLKKEERY